MLLRVTEQGSEVHVELQGVKGQQHRVLQALTSCKRGDCSCQGDRPLSAADVTVRAGLDEMRIRLKGQGGARIEPNAIYRCLRRALFEQPESGAAPAAAVAG